MPSTVPFPFHTVPNIQILVDLALRTFSRRALSFNSVTLGTGARMRPVEALYQDEFYRALHKVLGFSARVSSEWAGDNSGRIDFRIADANWGLEVLREGDRLGEHCQRFVGDGSYARWIREGWLSDWLIVDCRTSQPRPYCKFLRLLALRCLYRDSCPEH